MGSFIYDRTDGIDIDDRTLAHLQAVMFDKMRRGESFALDLHDERRAITVWISPRSPLAFTYIGGRRPELNRAWIEDMSGSAGVYGVLRLTPEPSDEISESEPR